MGASKGLLDDGFFSLPSSGSYVCVDEYMKRRLEIKLIHAIVVDLK